MNKHLKIFIVPLAAVCLFSAVGFYAAFAQTGSIVIEMNPNIPAPNANITISARSYDFDIFQARLTWFLDGKNEAQGTGKTSFSFVAGDVGSRTVLRIVARTPNGNIFEKTVAFTVADIDLLWEAPTYTPAWHKGKALAVPGSLIKISAIPHFKSGAGTVSSNNIIFNWSLNDTKLYDKSGTGRDVLYIRANQFTLAEYKIGIEAQSLDGTLQARKTLEIGTVKPEVLLYRENPLEGAEFQSAIKIINVRSGQDIKIKAEPYYFLKEDFNDLSFNWLASGAPIQKTGRQNVFSFNSAQGLSGLVSIELIVKNVKNIFQEASAKFNINVE